MQTSINRVKVWDLFVRCFHWSLVLSFCLAYISSQAGMQTFHTWLGYFITIILLARLIWGFIGGPYARFSNFIFSPGEIIEYIKSSLTGTPEQYRGHNPAGSVMVFALLITLFILSVSGFILLGGLEFEGPTIGLVAGLSDETIYLTLAVHRFCLDLMWFLIAFHITGVVTAGVQHRENLVKAMITGYKNI